jgi:uncharacterized protein YjbI with pentapeptide repeats
MNNYVRKLFGVMFQRRQAQQVVRIQPQSPPMSPEGWPAHWRRQGLPWRTEAEIPLERQQELSKCRDTLVDIKNGIYPFKGVHLCRADVEWLLATHEDERDPVDWSDGSQSKPKGLDLQGADLRKADLKGLPLAGLNPSFEIDYLAISSELDRDKAAALHLEGANLFDERTTIHLEGADLSEARLEGSNLVGAHLEMAHLQGSYLVAANLSQAYLQGVNLNEANLNEANLILAHLEMAEFRRAHLKGADLSFARLGKSTLMEAHLEGANLNGAHLEGANLWNAHLEGANLQRAFFDSATELEGIHLGNDGFDGRKVNLFGKVAYFATHILGQVVLFWGHQTHHDKDQTRHDKYSPASLADVRWGDAVLAVVKWSLVEMPGEEYKARQKKHDGKVKDKDTQIEEYEDAIRANRQLAVALQSEGLDEDAKRFAYRAQNLQRKLLWKQRNFWRWFGSAMLALLAGYGYRMWHILVAYLLIVLLCAGAYFVLGMYYEPHLSLLEAVLTSVTAFHGRVFSEPFLRPVEPQLWVTAFEAVSGLVIEGVFIAMLTQKFFGK